MEFKDWLAFYFERSNAANDLWGFYITVVFGLMAYFGVAARSRQKVLLAIIISFGFVGFAFVNEKAIIEVTEARLATAKLIAEYRSPNPAQQPAVDEIKKTVNPPSLTATSVFHIGSDITVLIGLWVLTRYEGSEAKPS